MLPQIYAVCHLKSSTSAGVGLLFVKDRLNQELAVIFGTGFALLSANLNRNFYTSDAVLVKGSVMDGINLNKYRTSKPSHVPGKKPKTSEKSSNLRANIKDLYIGRRQHLLRTNVAAHCTSNNTLFK